jgi:hypothetical protein
MKAGAVIYYNLDTESCAKEESTCKDSVTAILMKSLLRNVEQ